MKEKYKVTEMQKMKNRIGFNVAEEENEHGEGFGMLGQSGVGGQLRVLAKDNKEMKKLEKLNKSMFCDDMFIVEYSVFSRDGWSMEDVHKICNHYKEWR